MEAKILAVGLNGQSETLRRLPLQLIATDTGMEAIEQLRNYGIIDTVVARWDLPDMKDGELIRRIKYARPWIPAVVLLDEPYHEREILVRGLGVVALLPATVSGENLCRVITQILGIEKVMAPSENRQSSYSAVREILHKG